MKTTLGHTMISASAGSGKTHALVNRTIRLLAHKVRPERIIALTFTRKAAG
jgi:ATP-dependent helicase/nuclease subunit A